MGATLLGAVGWAWPGALSPCSEPVEPLAETVLEEEGLLWIERTSTDREAPVALVVRRPGEPCLLLSEDTAVVGLVGPGPVQIEAHALDGGQPSLAVHLAHTPLSALTDAGMRPALALEAARAADTAWDQGQAQGPHLAVIDFGLPSDEERLWLIALDEARVSRQWMVSHGKMSGGNDKLDAVRFSNRPYSNQSSLGLYVGAETYVGSHGRSLRLDGLEPAFNDRARDRAIVVHGAAYARPEHVAEWGYLGRSFGCPAIDDREAQLLIDALAEGSLLFIGHPGVDWRAESELWWE